jgi:DNA-binding protein H-NS
MPDSNGSDRLDRTERTLEATNKTLAELSTVVVRMAQDSEQRFRAFDERQDRIQRHLKVLIDVVDGLIRDRRFKELEKRVSDLEQGGGQA